MQKINTRELSQLIQEADALSSKPSWSKSDERRHAFLLSAIAAVRAGGSLAEIQQEELNETERKHGLRQTRIRHTLTSEQRQWGMFFQRLVKGNGTRGVEFRDEAEGNVLSQIGNYAGISQFVPTDFYDKIFSAMAAHDPLFDEDAVTVINSTNAHPLPIPTYDDISNVATAVGEGQDLTGDSADLGHPGHAVLGSHSYRSPITKYSMEIFDDLETTVTAEKLFIRYTSDRLARGVGADLLKGAGPTSSGILGLIPSLEVLGVNAIVAAGSSSNDGTGTKSNSIGTQDLVDLFYSINEAYRVAPMCRWLMNDTTLTFLSGLLDKLGRPIVNYFSGNDGGSRVPVILNREVLVSPSMDNLGSYGNVPVVFGDLSFWCTRIISDELTRVRVLKERYIESGQYGLQMIARFDGALAFTGQVAHTPINYLVQHS